MSCRRLILRRGGRTCLCKVEASLNVSHGLWPSHKHNPATYLEVSVRMCNIRPENVIPCVRQCLHLYRSHLSTCMALERASVQKQTTLYPPSADCMSLQCGPRKAPLPPTNANHLANWTLPKKSAISARTTTFGQSINARCRATTHGVRFARSGRIWRPPMTRAKP